MSDWPRDHNKRLAEAVATYNQRRKDGTLTTVESPVRFPMPTLVPDSPDMNVWDNVIPLSKHPRWRWFS